MLHAHNMLLFVLVVVLRHCRHLPCMQVGPLTQASLAEGLTLLMSQQQQQAAGGGGSQQQQGTGGPVGLGGMTQGRRRIEAARCGHAILVSSHPGPYPRTEAPCSVGRLGMKDFV